MTELKKPFLSEKKLIIEVLKLYQESPCLWDINHLKYTNREARANAYKVILEKYRLLQPDANLDIVKKKIENMRAGYRRERKKVVQELLKYGENRRPLLWYYEHLKFLDATLESNASQKLKEEDEQDNANSEMETNLSTIYLTEEHLDSDEDSRNSYVVNDQLVHTNTAVNRTMNTLTEGEAFGNVIGLQLNELQPIQRYIAEKLISEVIYYGRFDKLDISTRLKNVQ